MGTEDEGDNPATTLIVGSAVVKEVDEITDENMARSTSTYGDNTTSRSTAKRKKSEKDC